LKGNLRLLNGRKVKSPTGEGTRPTTSIVREALMNILGERIKESYLLDLFSGSGIIGCEALQKGAQKILAIESNKRTAQLCQSNLLNASKGLSHSPQTKVICCDVIKQLRSQNELKSTKIIKNINLVTERFDIVYIDPPYRSKIIYSVLEELLKGSWLNKDALVIYEHNSESIKTINSKWLINKQKRYGKTALLFLTPNQA